MEAVMRFALNIQSQNAAFEEAPAEETCRLLRKVALLIERGEALEGALQDVNGNHCGTWELADDR